MYSRLTERLVCEQLVLDEDARSKYSVCLLQIELTRRCNLKCPHCMQGDPQNLDISDAYIDSIMEQVGLIHCLGLSGGEITLSLDRFRYVLDSAKRHDVRIKRIIVTTNGVIMNEEFLQIYRDYMSYVMKPEICEIQISKDRYHSFASGLTPEDYEERKAFFEDHGRNVVKYLNAETDSKKGLKRVGRISQNPLSKRIRSNQKENDMQFLAWHLAKSYEATMYRPISYHGKHICNLLLTSSGFLRVSDIISNVDADDPKSANGRVEESIREILIRESKDPFCQTFGAFFRAMNDLDGVKAKFSLFTGGFQTLKLMFDFSGKKAAQTLECITKLSFAEIEIYEAILGMIPTILDNLDQLSETSRKSVLKSIDQIKSFDAEKLKDIKNTLENVKLSSLTAPVVAQGNENGSGEEIIE